MLRTLALPIMLAASATPALAQPRAPAGAYSAHGTEPFWNLTLDGRQMRFSYDEQTRTAPQPRIVRMGAARRYTTPNMVVLVTPEECSDGMSERLYADTVRVTLTRARAINGNTRFEGCGGGIVRPQTLSGTHWRITAINAAAMPGDGRYELTFENGRITGAAGCNRLSGPYRDAGGVLTAGPLVSTRMACPGERMAQERAAMAILQAGPRITYPAGASHTRLTMVLTSRAGSMRLEFD